MKEFKKCWSGVLLVALVMLSSCNAAPINGLVLVNHVGYPVNGVKKMIFQTVSEDVPSTFELIDQNGQSVYQGTFLEGGTVDQWHTGNVYVGKFSDFLTPGKYTINATCAGQTFTSVAFDIKENLILQQAMPLMLEGLKSIRPAEKYEQWDAKCPIHDDDSRTADVRGGWYDASGDFSKYLSHLNYTNFMMPQQTPMVAYNLLVSAELASESGDLSSDLIAQMIEESVWGADFLVRMQDEAGYFYTTVFDNWSKDPTRRAICAYETANGDRYSDYKAAFREGAGISIAILAKLSTTEYSGEYDASKYLKTAERGFAHLLVHNSSYCDDGQENIIDDYCALLAAVELYKATGKVQYLDHSRVRAKSLTDRLSNDENYTGWFRADNDGTRSYFHAAEAGYPLITLTSYLDIETDEVKRASVIHSIQQAVAFELNITNEVYNPFGYPRQYVKAVDESEKRASFFVPHVNESGYWYQGENARLASLVAAFNLSKQYMLPEQQASVQGFVQNQLDWIFGLNPYDICMLDGLGYNNPEYLAPHNWNYRGGIANGITAGVENENDIAYLPEAQKDDMAQNWRWPEQWIPHVGWLMLALTSEK